MRIGAVVSREMEHIERLIAMAEEYEVRIDLEKSETHRIDLSASPRLRGLGSELR